MTYEIDYDLARSETQAKIHDAVMAITDSSVSGLTSFSLLAKLNGKVFGAASAVLKSQGEDAPKSVAGSAIDAYNDILASLNDAAASARFFEDTGADAPLDPVVVLRQRLHLREVVCDRLGMDAPFEETMRFLFVRAVEELPPLSEAECRKTARRVGKDADAYWQQRQQDRVRQIQGIKTRLDQQLDTLKEQGRLLELTAQHGDVTSEEDRLAFEYPADTLEVLAGALEGARKGVAGRSRGRSEEEINADLDLLDSVEALL